MVAVILLISLLILSFVIAVSLFVVLITGKTPLLNTPNRAMNALLNEVKLDETSIFYDLGCGTSKVLIPLAKNNPNSKFVGIDNSLVAYLFSVTAIKIYRLKNVSIKLGNFYNHNYSDATHIYMWIFTEAMDRMLPKFEKELKPGTSVYSLSFRFSNKAPSKTITLSNERWLGNTLYVYKF